MTVADERRGPGAPLSEAGQELGRALTPAERARAYRDRQRDGDPRRARTGA